MYFDEVFKHLCQLSNEINYDVKKPIVIFSYLTFYEMFHIL